MGAVPTSRGLNEFQQTTSNLESVSQNVKPHNRATLVFVGFSVVVVFTGVLSPHLAWGHLAVSPALGQTFVIVLDFALLLIGFRFYLVAIRRQESKHRLAEQSLSSSLRKSEELSAATLNSMHSAIAVLGRDGTVVAINESWRDSETHNIEPGSELFSNGVGANYVSYWEKAVHASHPCAQEVIDGITSVLSGGLSYFRLDYPKSSSGEVRWYTMIVTPLGAERRGAVISNSDITVQKRAEENVKKSLEEKQTLLRELYHRTKNNMAVVIALLNMQSSEFEDERMIQAFNIAGNRIRSMALVHEKLYDANDLTRINLREYIDELVSLLVSSHKVSVGHLDTTLELDEVFLPIENAIPCGLILNELISNALKHAFPSAATGEIKIVLHKDNQSVIHLRVQDNGRGVPVGFDFRQNANLGLQTIFLLGESQLKGKVEFRTETGVECRVSFSPHS